MCLRTITWQSKNNNSNKSKVKWQTGYKVFNVNLDKIYSPFYNLEGMKIISYITEKELSIGIIYKNKSKNEICAYLDSKYYKTGFHIFPVAMAAKLFSGSYTRYRNIFEVQYRKVTCIGDHSVHTSYPVDCVIAQEMKIVRCLSNTEIEKILKDEERIERTD
jgi:hypothetical protein